MPTDDNNFFEDLGATVQGELQKEKTKTKMSTPSQVQVSCVTVLSFVYLH